MQKTWVRILTTVLTLSVMAMIFFFSTEEAEQSDQTSGTITKQVLEITNPGYEKMPEPEKTELYNSTQTIVRKVAHFTEFGLLGFSLRFCLESWLGSRRKRLGPAAFLCGAGYAGLDELHQTLVDGRAGQWRDVGIDSSGVLAGVLAAAVILIWVKKKMNHGG